MVSIGVAARAGQAPSCSSGSGVRQLGERSQGARIGLQRLRRPAVDEQRGLAAGGERQVQRQADRAGADDQDVDFADGVSHGA